jgi:glutamate synthase (NADPH) small chain
MGNKTGFLEVPRKDAGNRPIQERIVDFGEVEQTLNEGDRKLQASRCMDCGVPFCNWGCPLGNIMPEWQDDIYNGDWDKAIENLHLTNNFPEFTGRICPAPCEKSCVLGINELPVTIRENEAAAAEKGFDLGFIKPHPPLTRTGKKVAVIGSGPAGLACADLLNKWGHTVTLFEKDDAVGGLLRYGIPDFKLSKHVIDRRIDILVKEGLIIKANTNIGKDIKPQQLLNDFDAVCIAIGAGVPRDIQVAGRELKGIHFAMDFLKQQNQEVRGVAITGEKISAKDKHVIVIGGGDTGSDCVGTSTRQKAASITQIEILPKPPIYRNEEFPWPMYPTILKTSSSHEEGCERLWSVATKNFIGKNGELKVIEVVDVKWEKDQNGKFVMKEVKGSERTLKADLVLLAMGFVHCEHSGLTDAFGLEYDQRGNIKMSKGTVTTKAKVFAAGDAVIGASLVVRAIAHGRMMAEDVNKFLMSSK